MSRVVREEVVPILENLGDHPIEMRRGHFSLKV
jgi:hypothetical protein